MEEKFGSNWYDGILTLFSSRKFWLAVVAVIQTVVFQVWPNIDPQLWESINYILMALIAAIAIEDAALKLSGK